jgi:hypothetical protein
MLVQRTRDSRIGEDNSNVNLEKLFCDSAYPVAPEPAAAGILDTRHLSVMPRLFVAAYC